MKKIAKRVLIIDDDTAITVRWICLLEDMGVVVNQATTLEGAKTDFANHPDVNVIVMDACLIPGEGPTTLELTKEIRKVFAGPIIANSNSVEYQDLLMLAGCDYRGDKGASLVGLIASLLKSKTKSKRR
jgi:CheY-like chemotaxis protein